MPHLSSFYLMIPQERVLDMSLGNETFTTNYSEESKFFCETVSHIKKKFVVHYLIEWTDLTD